MLDPALTLGAWACLVVPFAVVLAGTDAPAELILRPTGSATRAQVEFLLGPAFLLAIARLVRQIIRVPERRAALVLLLITFCQWLATSAYSSVVLGSPQPTDFRSVSGALVAAGLGSLAAYLFLDGRRGSAASALPVWLDAAMASGGAISLSSLIVGSPWAIDAVAQPVVVTLEIGCLLIVVTQLLLGHRPVERSGLLLLAGLSAMITCDSLLAWFVLHDSPGYPVILDIAWGVAGLILMAAGCRAESPRVTPPDAAALPSPATAAVPGTALTLIPVIIATLTLSFLPPGPSRAVALGPALLTLAAAGARLVLGLHTARGAAEAYRRSLTDDVTGLPNRRAVLVELDQRLHGQRPVGLMMLDLNGFAEVNDTLGHLSGDEMLRAVGTRLRDAEPGALAVARLGADEFCLLVPDTSAEELSDLATRLRAVVRQPVVIAGLSLTLDATFGAVAPDPAARDGGDLLRRGDIALAQARAAGLPYAAYDPERDTFSRGRLQLADELRRAIAEDQLELWYQPQLDLASGTVPSVEALVRWRHPQRGLIPPGEFLDLARRFGLMPALTEITMRLAVRDAASWQSAGMPLRVALNVAPAELLTGDSMALLRDLVTEAGLSGEVFVVEVTEDTFLADRERAQAVIRDLREAGFDVSVDDYGTGFSSLSYLRDLSLCELKVDRTFIAAIDRNERSAAIVSTTTALAHALGLRIVAEGVESAEALTTLRRLGVDLVQGYHVARPMPAPDVAGWVAALASPDRAHATHR